MGEGQGEGAKKFLPPTLILPPKGEEISCWVSIVKGGQGNFYLANCRFHNILISIAEFGMRISE